MITRPASGGAAAHTQSSPSQANGPHADGKHGSNVSAILESLAADPEKAKAAADYGFSKYVAELSLEELMAANLSGDAMYTAPACQRAHVRPHLLLVGASLSNALTINDCRVRRR